MKKTKNLDWFNVFLVALGTIFVCIAIFYWSVPANDLPSFMPGYDLTLTAIHFKHGLAALIVAIALFVVVWFRDGKKKKHANGR